MPCWQNDVGEAQGTAELKYRRLGFTGAIVNVQGESGWVELQSRAPVSAASRACPRPLSPARPRLAEKWCHGHVMRCSQHMSAFASYL